MWVTILHYGILFIYFIPSLFMVIFGVDAFGVAIVSVSTGYLREGEEREDADGKIWKE
jgi:hypothetical protein